MNKEVLNCQLCKKSFLPSRCDQTFCSSVCYREDIRLGKIEQNRKLREVGKCCEGCSKHFIPKQTRYQRFCTPDCLNEHRKKVMREANAELRNNTKKICPTCQNEFTAETTLYQKYCSLHCRKLFPRKIHSMLRHLYQQTDESKQHQSHEVLGYTPNQLREHVQKHPNWKKLKDSEWHLDHIFPIKAFLDYGIKDISLICTLENLQPLAKVENLKKTGKYSKPKFEKWLKTVS